MPNHVTHTLTVTGPPAAVDLFVGMHIIYEKAREGNENYWKLGGEAPTPRFFDFNTVIPMPKILEGSVSGGHTNDAVEAITGKSLEQIVYERHPDDPHAQGALRIHNHFSTLRDPQREAEHKKRLENMTVEQLEHGRRALQAIEETGYPSWYEWSIANWGTKWNSYDLSIVTEEPGRFVCRFDTAWSPPTPVLEKVAEMHPELDFVVDGFDEGWGFAIHGERKAGQPWEFFDVACDEDTHEAAYGYRPEKDDEANEQIIQAVVAPTEAVEEPDPLSAPPADAIRKITLEDE